MNVKAFVSLSLAIFSTMLGLGIVAPLMAIYATDLGASGLWLGIMYSSFSLSRAVFMPITGGLSDRKGRKNFMIVGLITYATISILYTLATNIYQLASVRLLQGVASAMVIPVAQAYVGNLIPRGKEGTYMSRFTMSMYLGVGLGPLLGGTLAEFWSISSVFYVMGGFAALALALLWPLVPRVAPQKQSAKAKSVPILTMIKDNKVKATGLYMASRAVFRQSIIAFLPILAVNTLGMSTSSLGLVLSLYLLSGALAQGLFGPIADRFNKNMLIIFGSIFAPVLVFFLPGMNSTQGFLAILVPVALISALSRVSAMAISVEVGSKYRRMGSSMGVINGAMSLGQFIGPLVFGYVMDRFGVGSVFTYGAVFGVSASFLMAYWLLKKEPQAALELPANDNR
jgi:MFS family permease